MDIKDFLPELRTMIQGPLQLIMADELYSSAIIFCKKAQVIRETLIVGDVLKGDTFTIASVAQDLSPWGVVCLIGDNVELILNVHYKQLKRNEVTFLEDVKSVSLTAWFYPTNKANIPDDVLPFSREISAGAAAKLYLQTNTPWTNAGLHQHYDAIFVEGHRNAWRDQLEQFGSFQNPVTNNSVWY